MSTSPHKRQAVVLIHGIGEQHPIVTLRNFVESVAGYYIKKKNLPPNDVIFWDKPDPESGNYETRKMTMREGPNHSTTDFYEFYWAQHMRTTNSSHVWDWLQSVAFRWPHKISPRLLPVFLFVWGLFLGLLLGMGIYIHKFGALAFVESFRSVSSSILATLVLGYFTRFLFNYLGDAARYLDPSPGNIEERQKIRAEGVALLKKLHQSGRYSRIVIVGHSLGSVIGYDLVKFLWNEYYKEFDRQKWYATHTGNNAMLHQVDASEDFVKKGLLNQGTVNDFQQAQGESFDYLQAIGNQWLVTDLLTIGSPLSYAGHLFIYQDNLFEKLKEQREYPTCPPRIQRPDKTNIIPSESFSISGQPHPFTCECFNHSSPFAATRWTNIYYHSDFIGGPLQSSFGVGIKDIAVVNQKWIGIYPVGHTRYWDPDNKMNVLKEIWEVLKI